MSDEDDYEYEYDDDDDAMEAEFQYTDDEEEQDDAQVELENAYYNSKSLRDDVPAAVASFEHIIAQESAELAKSGSDKTYGPWSFKAMKQLVKLRLRVGDDDEKLMQDYRRLLECIAQGDVSPNAVEKGINGMLERVATLYQGSVSATASGAVVPNGHQDPQKIALAVYDATLQVFHPQTGNTINERLWFKTNLKYGQLLYEMNEANKLEQVLRDLQTNMPPEDSGSASSSTQSMEIYALQIQLYSRQKDHKRLRETFQKAMAVRGGIPHPRTIALIQELGGKTHMASREYNQAEKTFFQAFKSYDEAGDPSRLRCLKYLVLASMLHASAINPFDSQEARPYRDDPEIVAMTNLVQAFHANDIAKFERVLRQNRRTLHDEFINEHVQDLLRTIRTQVLERMVRPYRRISLHALAEQLNHIEISQVESLLTSLILNGTLQGKIDRVDMVLYNHGDHEALSAPASGGEGTPARSYVVQRCEAMDNILSRLNDLSAHVTNIRANEPSTLRIGGFYP